MSAVTYARYQATAEERFRRLLVAWLATLPRDGWTGGAAELFAALDAFEREGRFCAYVPTGSALTKALIREVSTVRAAGFALGTKRTKAARSIVFAPVEP